MSAARLGPSRLAQPELHRSRTHTARPPQVAAPDASIDPIIARRRGSEGTLIVTTKREWSIGSACNFVFGAGEKAGNRNQN